MRTYIAFLRGVNVGGKNKIPMSELRVALESEELKSVRTYIQSGNVVFESSLDSCDEISTLINKTIQNNFNFNIPVLVKKKKQLELVLSLSPYDNEDQITTNKTYFIFFFESPKEQFLDVFKALTFPNEQYKITDDCLYLLCLNGYGNSKLNNNLIESKLKVIATARNYRTMQKVLALVD